MAIIQAKAVLRWTVNDVFLIRRYFVETAPELGETGWALSSGGANSQRPSHVSTEVVHMQQM